MIYGYDATLLIDICTAIIDANRAGVYPNDNPQILNSILYNFKCIPLLKKANPTFASKTGVYEVSRFISV